MQTILVILIMAGIFQTDLVYYYCQMLHWVFTSETDMQNASVPFLFMWLIFVSL